jgi:hypothetical protein
VNAMAVDPLFTNIYKYFQPLTQNGTRHALFNKKPTPLSLMGWRNFITQYKEQRIKGMKPGSHLFFYYDFNLFVFSLADRSSPHPRCEEEYAD